MMGRYKGALRQIRCVLVAVFTGLAGVAAHADTGSAVPYPDMPGIDRPSQPMLGLYLGLLAGLFFYNFLLSITLRDRVYRHYIALVASSAALQLSHSGLGISPTWSDAAPWDTLLQVVSLSLVGLFSLLFARAFLVPGERAPQIDQTIRGLLFLWPAALVVAPWISESTATASFGALGLLTISVLLLDSAQAWRTQRPGARSLALAWGAQLAGAMGLLAVHTGAPPLQSLSPAVLMLGSAVAMVLLSFALAERSRAEHAASRQALAVTVRQQVEHEAAKKASMDKARFLVAVSHDLRQPLYAMTLATESMSRQRPLRHPGPMLAQMKSALESADGLLDAIHMVARLENGSLKPEIVDFSVQHLLERLDERYAERAHALGLRWTMTPSLIRVRSDPQLLERMLSNLISNALRFTEEGGVVVACRARQEHLLVQVWDTGKGILPDEEAAIHGAHFRGVPESDTDNGVGLGLAIVRRCAGLLDIEFSVRSCPGRGSCFSLRVPLARMPLAVAA